MSSKRTQVKTLDSPASSTSNGEGRSNNHPNDNDHVDKKFKQVHGDDDEDEDDDDDEEAPKTGKRAGRRKIKIEYIEDKSRRHITFSKRKSGIMKKAYELSTLTGTQVLLLVVSETGLVYTFTTPKLQPLVTKAEGKNLIQACLHAPDKESTPDNAGGDPESPDATAVADYEDHPELSPQASQQQLQAQQAQALSQQSSPQQQQQQLQQQQHTPYPPQPQSGQQGGYGSSSAMSVPSYPPPYGHIPFPAQYNYPSQNMYQGAPGGGPAQGGAPQGGNQYWSGPPSANQSVPGMMQGGGQGATTTTKGGRKGGE